MPWLLRADLVEVALRFGRRRDCEPSSRVLGQLRLEQLDAGPVPEREAQPATSVQLLAHPDALTDRSVCLPQRWQLSPPCASTQPNGGAVSSSPLSSNTSGGIVSARWYSSSRSPRHSWGHTVGPGNERYRPRDEEAEEPPNHPARLRQPSLAAVYPGPAAAAAAHHLPLDPPSHPTAGRTLPTCHEKSPTVPALRPAVRRAAPTSRLQLRLRPPPDPNHRPAGPGPGTRPSTRKCPEASACCPA